MGARLFLKKEHAFGSKQARKMDGKNVEFRGGHVLGMLTFVNGRQSNNVTSSSGAILVVHTAMHGIKSEVRFLVSFIHPFSWFDQRYAIVAHIVLTIP